MCIHIDPNGPTHIFYIQRIVSISTYQCWYCRSHQSNSTHGGPHKLRAPDIGRNRGLAAGTRSKRALPGHLHAYEHSAASTWQHGRRTEPPQFDRSTRTDRFLGLSMTDHHVSKTGFSGRKPKITRKQMAPGTQSFRDTFRNNAIGHGRQTLRPQRMPMVEVMEGAVPRVIC